MGWRNAKVGGFWVSSHIYIYIYLSLSLSPCLSRPVSLSLSFYLSFVFLLFNSHSGDLACCHLPAPTPPPSTSAVLACPPLCKICYARKASIPIAPKIRTGVSMTESRPPRADLTSEVPWSSVPGPATTVMWCFFWLVWQSLCKTTQQISSKCLWSCLCRAPHESPTPSKVCARSCWQSHINMSPCVGKKARKSPSLGCLRISIGRCVWICGSLCAPLYE